MDDQKFKELIDQLTKKIQLDLNCSVFISKVFVDFIVKSLEALRKSNATSDEVAQFFYTFHLILINLNHVDAEILRDAIRDVFETIKKISDEIEMRNQNGK